MDFLNSAMGGELIIGVLVFTESTFAIPIGSDLPESPQSMFDIYICSHE